MQQQHKPHLLRGLNARHIRFIALGSAIGTGLFYGSASAIKAAGPAVLLAYLIGGAAVFIVMRALGEMAVRNPVSGSFGSYARQYLGPLAGFITGWTYTFEMVIVALADVTAFGIYMGLWYPDVPRWIWILSIIFFIGAMNLCNVRVFGEMEFWLSLVKVVAIIAMMLAGAGLRRGGDYRRHRRRSEGSEEGDPAGHQYHSAAHYPVLRLHPGGADGDLPVEQLWRTGESVCAYFRRSGDPGGGDHP